MSYMSYADLELRPSAAIVSSLQQEKQSLESFLLRLKSAKPAQASAILEGLYFADGSLQLPDRFSVEASGSRENSSSRSLTRSSNAVDDGDADTASDVGFDPSNHVSVDDHGQLGVFGLTSTLHDHVQGIDSNASSNAASEKNNYQLIANAALERQKEFRIRLLPDIDGVPLNIATHLLDLHWNRQHHTFLLTYRPALMRDLLHGGPYCSKLLLNAIFACASKYSDRIYLRDNPSDPLSAGRRFFLRCDELIASEPPFGRPSIPTVVAFLLLGSTFIARGDISKGWAYTGFAARMVYDLGLHLDCKPKTSSEDIEIRRRVFWGAFICDKLQSLYLGRPMAMHLHDNQCPADFADTFEELDLWTPYVDPEVPSSAVVCQPTPVYSVSTFQQLCYLSKLMTRIINCFYSSHTIISKAATNLETLDAALSYWYTHLPTHLAFDDRVKNKAVPSPNVLLEEMHGGGTEYYEHCIRVSWYLHLERRSVPDQLCGVHGEHSRLLMLSLKALDALSTPNPGVTKPAGMIRRLMRKHQIIEPRVIQSPDPSHVDFSYIPELSPQSMTLTSLFDTFVPNQEFGELVGSNGVSSIDNEQWMNDSLFGFMNAVDGFQAAEGTGWTGAGGVLPG
ncbi:putative Transcription factor domain-containing protein [Seiridium cardinale]